MHARTRHRRRPRTCRASGAARRKRRSAKENAGAAAAPLVVGANRLCKIISPFAFSNQIHIRLK
jgi:hypothetical protein